MPLLPVSVRPGTPPSQEPSDLEGELADLLQELTAVQDDLLKVLAEKRERMAAQDLAGMAENNAREAELAQRLDACHQRREALLANARQQGWKVESLGKLAAVLQPGVQAGLGKQVRLASSRMQLLHHQSLTNWVLAQRSLLHLSQLLEIIATGGRPQPTYGAGDASLSRGALVDSEA